MSQQQAFIEVISQNIANAETTKTADGTPYRRQVARAVETPSGELRTEIVEDKRPGRAVYDPGHPDADETGYVRYPNVEIAAETIDLMIARRMHEANATVFQAAKAMLRRALEI